ncbi:S-adenosyl methyltransferase [Frankia canadensis]|uniref:S-adenosyl methyltransferase n=1 Tax=Frankia canadensis TaxID=1836972 RepID=A0A2I2KNG8_9ACTN|nr:SAM-dependent methyltransferase [Frankia canadensis]SNQ47208.1 S-adenosyl methyltransferase [Frankia canadensis]SOU54498.1 S-adenosyl methyltransferase [Frankia canadensis]
MTEQGWASPAAAQVSPVDLQMDRPHAARMYDLLLGGKDNFPADREAVEAAVAAFPHLPVAARQNRAFLHRAARLVAEVGVRQFFDAGTGIPTSPNLHEVVQAAIPDARVVYLDSDPIVLAHARALLTSSPQGRTAYLDADLRDVDRILSSPELVDTLDLTRPVALSLIAILHFVGDDDDPYGIVRRLVERLPSGSYLTISHAASDLNPDVERAAEVYRQRGVAIHPRSHAQIMRFFDGLELVEPGLVPVHRWHPDDPGLAAVPDAQVSAYGAVAAKP